MPHKAGSLSGSGGTRFHCYREPVPEHGTTGTDPQFSERLPVPTAGTARNHTLSGSPVPDTSVSEPEPGAEPGGREEEPPMATLPLPFGMTEKEWQRPSPWGWLGMTDAAAAWLWARHA
jgi:hypothetical protein